LGFSPTGPGKSGGGNFGIGVGVVDGVGDGDGVGVGVGVLGVVDDVELEDEESLGLGVSPPFFLGLVLSGVGSGEGVELGEVVGEIPSAKFGLGVGVCVVDMEGLIALALKRRANLGATRSPKISPGFS